MCLPTFGFRLTDADSYKLVNSDYFGNNNKISCYADEQCTVFTDEFAVGDRIYISALMNTYSGISISASDIIPKDLTVVDDGLKAVGIGDTRFNCSWYGVEGTLPYVWVRVGNNSPYI